MIKKLMTSALLLLLFISNAAAQRGRQFNLHNNLAIEGYDPVAYFEQHKAIKGKKELAVNAGGVTYYLSSPANRALFVKNYRMYEPAYGGWCAFAMGSTGEKVEVDPETFKIIEGKLYLFYNAFFNNTLNSWNKNEAALKKMADKNWMTKYADHDAQ